MSDLVGDLLNPVAEGFRQMNLPDPIVHWGHPLMMAIVVFVMGSVVGLLGWRGRMVTDPDVAGDSRTKHSQIATLMFVFMALGYTGGLLSLVMQGEPVLESPHFWTGSVVLSLLTLNGVLSLKGFGGGRAALRTAHAYLGSATLCLMFAHAVFGLRLGLSF